MTHAEFVQSFSQNWYLLLWIPFWIILVGAVIWPWDGTA